MKTFELITSTDPDEAVHNELFHLDSHCESLVFELHGPSMFATKANLWSAQ